MSLSRKSIEDNNESKLETRHEKTVSVYSQPSTSHRSSYLHEDIYENCKESALAEVTKSVNDSVYPTDSMSSVVLPNSKLMLENKWPEFLKEKLLSTIRPILEKPNEKNVEIEFNRFKFFLGANHYHKRHSQIRDYDISMRAKIFKLYCKIITLQSLPDMDILKSLLENEIIFSSYEKIKHRVNEFRHFIALHDEAKERIKVLGFESYAKWVADNSLILAKIKSKLSPQESIAIEPISDLIKLTLYDTLLETIKNKTSRVQWWKLDDDFSMKLKYERHAYLVKYREKFIQQLLRGNSFEEMEAIVASETAVVASINKSTFDANELSPISAGLPEDEKFKSFKLFAKNWLLHYDNLGESSELLEKGDKIISTKDLIYVLDKYKKSGRWQCMLNKADVQALFKAIEQMPISPIKQEEFRAELEKHYPSDRFEEILQSESALRFNTKANTKEIREMKIPYPSFLESVIKNDPIEWDRLELVLYYLKCCSEAQVALKNLLLIYISTWSTSGILLMIKQMLLTENELREKKFQVEYLISCLYLASQKQIDEGILFSHTAESVLIEEYDNSIDDASHDNKKKIYAHAFDNAVGVTFILAGIAENIKEKRKTSYKLKEQLEKFLLKINNDQILYLRKSQDKSSLKSLCLMEPVQTAVHAPSQAMIGLFGSRQEFYIKPKKKSHTVKQTTIVSKPK